LFIAKPPDAFDIQGAMMDLNNYLASMPYIHSIYVYNPVSKRYYMASQNGQRGMINDSDIKDESIVGILDNYLNYTPFHPIPRIINSEENSQTTGVYTYLCYDAIG
jgi:two-component system response regulator YesN